MLPLLPALILLLLQGPSTLERLAHEGGLPSALNAIHSVRWSEDEKATRAEVEAIASLLALSSSPELSQALWSLLSFAVDEPKPLQVAAPDPPLHEVSHKVDDSGILREGFFRCQRSRDGPASIA